MNNDTAPMFVANVKSKDFWRACLDVSWANDNVFGRDLEKGLQLRFDPDYNALRIAAVTGHNVAVRNISASISIDITEPLTIQTRTANLAFAREAKTRDASVSLWMHYSEKGEPWYICFDKEHPPFEVLEVLNVSPWEWEKIVDPVVRSGKEYVTVNKRTITDLLKLYSAGHSPKDIDVMANQPDAQDSYSARLCVRRKGYEDDLWREVQAFGELDDWISIRSRNLMNAIKSVQSDQIKLRLVKKERPSPIGDNNLYGLVVTDPDALEKDNFNLVLGLRRD